MTIVRTILVPLDGSAVSEQALPLAQRLAAATGATLELVRVHRSTAQEAYAEAVGGGPGGAAGTTADEAAYLEARAEQTRGGGVTVTTSLLGGGEVAPAIAERARAVADLVIMTTHGRGPVSRLWLGSVADELLRTLDRPILLIRPTMDDWATSTGPPYRRVMIALDLSKRGAAAVDAAITLGSPETEFVLVHVGVVPALAVALPNPVDTEADTAGALGSKAAERLDAIAAGLRARDLKARTRIEIGGEPVNGILDAAQREAPDLIVIETKGASGVGRMVLGSVADKVVRAAQGPVLVVPAPH